MVNNQLFNFFSIKSKLQFDIFLFLLFLVVNVTELVDPKNNTMTVKVFETIEPVVCGLECIEVGSCDEECNLKVKTIPPLELVPASTVETVVTDLNPSLTRNNRGEFQNEDVNFFYIRKVDEQVEESEPATETDTRVEVFNVQVNEVMVPVNETFKDMFPKNTTQIVEIPIKVKTEE
jgi:hypothetical protein